MHVLLMRIAGNARSLLKDLLVLKRIATPAALTVPEDARPVSGEHSCALRRWSRRRLVAELGEETRNQRAVLFESSIPCVARSAIGVIRMNAEVS